MTRISLTAIRSTRLAYRPYSTPSMLKKMPRDPNTLSNYHELVTSHTIANFTIDFSKKQLRGNVLLDLRSTTEEINKRIILDSSFLDVKNVNVKDQPSKYKLLPRTEPYGSALEIELEKGVEGGALVHIDVSSVRSRHKSRDLWAKFKTRLKSIQQRNAPHYNGLNRLRHLTRNIRICVSLFFLSFIGPRPLTRNFHKSPNAKPSTPGPYSPARTPQV